jgi:hypothetical protein
VKEPADERSSAGFFVACPDAFAGKPAPTGIVSYPHRVNDTTPCRSWLASEEAIQNTEISNLQKQQSPHNGGLCFESIQL